MAEYIVLILMSLMVLGLTYSYFMPEIEIVAFATGYRIYLWYTAYEGPAYKRVCKYLFKINTGK